MLLRRRRVKNATLALFLILTGFYAYRKSRVPNGIEEGGNPGGVKWAYVFYATEGDYICYAMINAARLIGELAITQQAEILRVPRASPDLTDNIYYGQSYIRLEAFRLYQYSRIIVLDADGLVLRNMDHLFEMDLEGYPLAALNADYQESEWMSSIFLVAEPSPYLYGLVSPYLKPENIGKVADFAGGPRFDMDILNYVFDKGKKVKRLPAHIAGLDSYFFDSDRDEDFDKAYYVHFTAKKPFREQVTELWVLRNQFPSTAKGMRLMFTWFWEKFYVECQPLVRRYEHVTYVKKDKGFYYPDPNDMADYINNISNRLYH